MLALPVMCRQMRSSPIRHGNRDATNGLQWQVLRPQRPSDRIEVRLVAVNTGSLTESTQQSGSGLRDSSYRADAKRWSDAAQARSLWRCALTRNVPCRPSYCFCDSTLYNLLSLPNNRNDLLKVKKR